MYLILAMEFVCISKTQEKYGGKMLSFGSNDIFFYNDDYSIFKHCKISENFNLSYYQFESNDEVSVLSNSRNSYQYQCKVSTSLDIKGIYISF